MSKWQNAELMLSEGVGKYNVPEILPTYEIPEYKKFVEFTFCKRVRQNHQDLAVHFFEDDYQFERCWTGPDRYAEMLSKFAFIVGPDFSQYVDFPDAISIYNHYRNNWLCRYWQDAWNITVVPTVMWGLEDSYEWCFDGYPKNSIVAVSNVGLAKQDRAKKLFINGYNEMLKRLTPSKVLFHTQNFMVLPGNVEYIPWALYKGAQIDGFRME